jgi:hypothetical protein
MRPSTSLGIEPSPFADAWPVGEVSLIVAGAESDGTGLSTTEGLAAGARRRPGLLVVRSARPGARSHEVDHAPGALQRIGVAFDGWDESRIALTAAALGERADGELVVLMVSDPRSAPSARGWNGDPLAGHRTVAACRLTTVLSIAA